MHAVKGSGRLIAGRYRLQWPIGRGAMGIVWHGRDELLDRDVAVKEVQITAQASPADAETIYQRTLREARTAARLNHPGVVTVFDVVEENGSPWIVMELVSARPLDRVITEDGPLTPLQAAELGTSLVGALEVAHAAGVLHRDVKPSNVLVEDDGRAVLTDFGIATFAGDPGVTQAGMVVGTPGFTAPERVRGEAATPASDLWSLGATLYTVVEGRGPFDRAGGDAAITAAVAIEDAPQAPSAGPLGPVIDALLSRDPAARPDATTTAALLADVAATASAASSGPHAAFLDPPAFGELSMPEPGDPAGALSAGQAPFMFAALNADLDGGVTAEFNGSAGAVDLGSAGSAGAGVAPSSSDGAGSQTEADGSRPGDSGPVLWQPVRSSLGEFRGTGSGDSDSGLFGGGPGRPGGTGGFRYWWRGGPARPAARRWKLVAVGGVAALVVSALVAWDLSSPSQPSRAVSNPAVPGVSAQATTVAGHKVPSSPSPAGQRTSGAPSHSASASASTSGKPSSGASSPASSPSPSGGPTASPSPSPSHSPSPSPSPKPSGPALPPGYVWHRFTAAAMGSAAGFEIAVPRLWLQSVSGKSASLYEAVPNYHLVVNLAPWTYPAAPLSQAQYLQRKYAKSEPGYKLLTLAAVGFKSIGGFEAASAAELKFKWTKPVLGSVTELVVVVTLPTKAGAQPYTFTLWAPSASFSLANGVFQTAMTTFRPLPG
jgi:eukaryotic-like serine/threonine-protein kinase